MTLQAPADDKEARARAETVQDIQHPGRNLRVRPIVERDGDLAARGSRPSAPSNSGRAGGCAAIGPPRPAPGDWQRSRPPQSATPADTAARHHRRRSGPRRRPAAQGTSGDSGEVAMSGNTPRCHTDTASRVASARIRAHPALSLSRWARKPVRGIGKQSLGAPRRFPRNAPGSRGGSPDRRPRRIPGRPGAGIAPTRGRPDWRDPSFPNRRDPSQNGGHPYLSIHWQPGLALLMFTKPTGGGTGPADDHEVGPIRLAKARRDPNVVDSLHELLKAGFH